MSTVPPLPPRRKSTQPNLQGQDDEPDIPAGGIAARIAALKLNQIGLNPNDSTGRNGTATPPTKMNGRPPVPRSVSAQLPSKDPNNRSNGNGTTHFGAHGKAPPPPPPRKIKRNSDINIGVSTISQDELARALRRPPPPIPPRRPSTPVLGEVEEDQNVEEEEDGEGEDGEEEEDEDEVQALEEPQAPTLPARRVVPPPLPQRRESSQSSDVMPVSNHPPALPSRPTPKPVPEPAYDSEPEQQEPAEEEEESCLICHDFSEVDAHAALFPREEVGTLKQLAYDLTAPFESLTDKARAIFTWLHHNVAYDAYSFLNNCVKPTTPEAVLRSGMAVCDGYGGLFADLALQAGLQALKVTGHGKGFGYTATSGGRAPPYESNHAWNAVVLDDNEWHLLDSCWGAGYLDAGGVYNKRFAPHFFTMSNIEFGKRHFPTDKGYQLREDGSQITWEDYILAPEGPIEYGTLRQQGYDYETLEPHTKTIQGGQKHIFHIEKKCWHLERQDWWDEYVLMISPSANDRVVIERDTRGPGNGWTVEVFVPSNSQQVQMYLVDTVDNKDAKGATTRDVRLAIGKKAMSFKGVVSWPVA